MGKVYFVGAGPGAPDLITLRGRQLLKQADCVIYDRLVSPELLKRTKPGCEKIYVGKEPDERGHGQTRIHRLLAEKSRRYPRVVRLKGGDPTIFGRLSEEMGALSKHRIPFEIVPGVSSVWAAAAGAGIPLTDRRLSSSVVIAAGHTAAQMGRKVLWKELGNAADTLVVLMGRTALPRIVERLRRVRPAGEPIALIRQASTPQQEILFSTLGKVAQDLAARPEFGPPVVAIIGKVVKLARKGTLRGRRVVLTRPREDQRELTRRLKALGAECVNLPTIAIRPHALGGRERARLLKDLPRYDWVLFNSRHGVEALDRLAKRSGRKLAELLRAKICAIGPRTRTALQAAGCKADLIPEQFSTQGIRKAFEGIPVRGRRILIPRSDRAIGDALASALRRRGARVDEVAVYKTLLRKIPAQRLRRALRRSDAITFTSASTAEGFLQAVKQARLPLRSVLNGTAIVAIGPATAAALRSAGVRQIAMPRQSWTVEGLVDTLIETIGNPA